MPMIPRRACRAPRRRMAATVAALAGVLCLGAPLAPAQARTTTPAKVPRTAVSGPISLVSADGAESAPTAVPLTIDAAGPSSSAGSRLGGRRAGGGQQRAPRRDMNGYVSPRRQAHPSFDGLRG